MKAVVASFNQEKALVGAFSVIVQPVVEPMDSFTALFRSVLLVVLLHNVALSIVVPSWLLFAAHSTAQFWEGKIKILQLSSTISTICAASVQR